VQVEKLYVDEEQEAQHRAGGAEKVLREGTQTHGSSRDQVGIEANNLGQ
jgi:hypothetical protein